MEYEPRDFFNIFLGFWLYEPHFLITFFLIQKSVGYGNKEWSNVRQRIMFCGLRDFYSLKYKNLQPKPFVSAGVFAVSRKVTNLRIQVAGFRDHMEIFNLLQ